MGYKVTSHLAHVHLIQAAAAKASRWLHSFRRSSVANETEEATKALLKVFAMFKLTPQQVIKLGSPAHLVELFGVSRKAVDNDLLQLLLDNDILVRDEKADLHLTETGYERMLNTAD